MSHKDLAAKKAAEEAARPAKIAAVKAACQVKIDDYRTKGVTAIGPLTDCRYPACQCKMLPAQVGAALAAHQAIELSRWRAELDRTREPPADDALDATDRAMLPRLMRKAADRIEADADPVPEIPPDAQLGA